MRRELFVILCAIMLIACSPQRGDPQTPTLPDDMEITLSRGPCFGACPIYTLTIKGDGTVIYNGINFVNLKGEITTHIDEARIKELITAFQRAEYFSLEDSYTGKVSDATTVITSIRYNGRFKKISNYGDCMTSVEGSAPQVLCSLENEIDKIVGAEDWVGKQ